MQGYNRGFNEARIEVLKAVQAQAYIAGFQSAQEDVDAALAEQTN